MNKSTTTIEIDLDVFKELNNQITEFGEPFNNVLRRILLIDPVAIKTQNKAEAKRQLEIVRPKLEISATGVEAKNGGIKVLKGSKFRKEATDGFKGCYYDLRNKMIQEGRFDSEFKLKNDYEFTSLCAAASVILGSQQNAGPWV